MKTNKLIALAFAAVMFMTACTKTGPTGPAGTNGANGANGATGPMGNANVRDTVFTALTTGWSTAAAYEYVTFTDNQITSSILSSGAVIAYWSNSGGAGWNILDFSSENPAGYLLDFSYTGTMCGFYFYGGGNPNSILGGANSMFKVVSIASQAMKRHPNTNWRDINQVNAVIAEEKGMKN